MIISVKNKLKKLAKGKTVKLPWQIFRMACRHHGGLRAGDVFYPDSGVCRESYPKKCYAKRCPIIKGNKQ